MRYSDFEAPETVLARLYANEPKWVDHPKTGRHPAAKGISAAHETRQSFEQRHEAWEQAVARETAARAEAGR